MPLNRRADQVPALAGPSLSVGYAVLPQAAAWLDYDSHGNADATHTKLIVSGSSTRELVRGLWIGGRVGLGPTLVHFKEPAFRDVVGTTFRVEGVVEAALGVSWVLWVRPMTFDLLSARSLGGPISTYELRVGVAYRFGSAPPRATPPPAQPGPVNPYTARAP